MRCVCAGKATCVARVCRQSGMRCVCVQAAVALVGAQRSELLRRRPAQSMSPTPSPPSYAPAAPAHPALGTQSAATLPWGQRPRSLASVSTQWGVGGGSRLRRALDGQSGGGGGIREGATTQTRRPKPDSTQWVHRGAHAARQHTAAEQPRTKQNTFSSSRRPSSTLCEQIDSLEPESPRTHQAQHILVRLTLAQAGAVKQLHRIHCGLAPQHGRGPVGARVEGGDEPASVSRQRAGSTGLVLFRPGLSRWAATQQQ